MNSNLSQKIHRRAGVTGGSAPRYRRLLVSQLRTNGLAKAEAAFTLTEGLIAAAFGLVVFAALYASFTCGYAAVKLNREDLRATQILLQRLETIRLSTFTNIQSVAAVDYYDPTDQASGGGGTIYNINVTAATPAASDMQGTPGSPIWYRTNMLLITATASWSNGVLRTRTMQTYVAKNGMADFIFKPR